MPACSAAILTLESHNLEAAERQLCELALGRAGSIMEAARLRRWLAARQWEG